MRIERTKVKNSAFTLIELLIGVTTAGIVGVLLIALLTQNSRIYTDQNNKIADGITLNNSAAKIEETIKSASSISAQYTPSGGPLFTTGANTLVLTQPTINSGGNVIENTYDYLVLSADNPNSKVLRLHLYPDALSSRKAQNKVLATNLSNLTFYFYSSTGETVSPTLATRVGFVINVNETVAGKTKIASTSGTVNLRNN